jgi:hypothetical protein
METKAINSLYFLKGYLFDRTPQEDATAIKYHLHIIQDYIKYHEGSTQETITDVANKVVEQIKRNEFLQTEWY